MFGTNANRHFQVWIGVDGDPGHLVRLRPGGPARPIRPARPSRSGPRTTSAKARASSCLPTTDLVVTSTAPTPGASLTYSFTARGADRGNGPVVTEMDASTVSGVTIVKTIVRRHHGSSRGVAPRRGQRPVLHLGGPAAPRLPRARPVLDSGPRASRPDYGAHRWIPRSLFRTVVLMLVAYLAGSIPVGIARRPTRRRPRSADDRIGTDRRHQCAAGARPQVGRGRGQRRPPQGRTPRPAGTDRDRRRRR